MNDYNVGNGLDTIQLTVDINTVGLAATRAIVIKVNSTDPGTSVAHSNDATGDVQRQPINKIPLKGMRLSVFTKIDITGADKETRKKEYERLTGKYVLEGSADGMKSFTEPIKTSDSNFKTAFLHMPIDLI